MVIRVGIVGLSEGNGHPFSFSAIINGFSDVGMAAAGWSGRVDEHGHASGSGHQRVQEFQPLCAQLTTEKLIPVRLPPGRARLATT